MTNSLPEDYRDGPFQVTESKTVWAGKVFSMKTDQVVLMEGTKPLTRDYMDHPGAVAIVALRPSADDADEAEVLLVSQYRHPVRATLWEIPAGLLDIANEDPLEAAKRELREETDLEATEWKLLVDIFTSPGGSNESLRIFSASGVFECEVPFNRVGEEAHMQKKWVPLSDAVDLILGGQLHNPSAVTGILAAHAAGMGTKRIGGAKPRNLRDLNSAWFR